MLWAHRVRWLLLLLDVLLPHAGDRPRPLCRAFVATMLETGVRRRLPRRGLVAGARRARRRSGICSRGFRANLRALLPIGVVFVVGMTRRGASRHRSSTAASSLDAMSGERETDEALARRRATSRSAMLFGVALRAADAARRCGSRRRSSCSRTAAAAAALGDEPARRDRPTGGRSRSTRCCCSSTACVLLPGDDRRDHAARARAVAARGSLSRAGRDLHVPITWLSRSFIRRSPRVQAISRLRRLAYRDIFYHCPRRIAGASPSTATGPVQARMHRTARTRRAADQVLRWRPCIARCRSLSAVTRSLAPANGRPLTPPRASRTRAPAT